MLAKLSISNRGLVLVAIACAALLVVISENSVLAGTCGDYLHSAPPPSMASPRAESQIRAHRAEEARPELPAAPCHGPQCKKTPARESSPPPPTPSQVHWNYDALLIEESRDSGRRDFFSRSTEPAESPSRLAASRLDRPPREC